MLEKLNQINFHDSGLIQFNIDFEKLIIELVFEEFGTKSLKKISFYDLFLLKMSKFEELDKFYAIEISSAEFVRIKKGIKAKFIFLLDFGKQDWNVEFSFKNVKILGKI